MIRNAIEISHLSKVYKGNDFPSVQDFSLNIAEGEIFGLLGPNGAGKSTLVNILCGLLMFNSGEVKIYGYSLPEQLKNIKPLIGVVPQDIALYPSLTAYENLKIFAGILGLTGKSANKRIDELLTFFGLEQSKHRRVETYSGGMKRRINLIAGLLHKPKILFLDEPTVGVDVQSKTLILDNLKEINHAGSTLIYTSHYLEEAEMLCTRVAFVDEGKLICEGVPAELTDGVENLEKLYLNLTGKKVRD